MIIEFKGKLPKYMTPDACAFDIIASGEWFVGLDKQKNKIKSDSYEIKPLERILAMTGLYLKIPQDYWGNIRDRSGLALKQGLHTLGGVIDSDYRGEIGVIIVNLSNKAQRIYKDDRIAQMIIQKHETAEFKSVKTLDYTDRGNGGFGHTG